MRKIGKYLVPLLAVLLMLTGLSVGVSAEFVLQESVTLSGDEASGVVTFTPDQEGTYRLFCQAESEEDKGNLDQVSLTVNGETKMGGEVIEQKLMAGETYVLSLTSRIPMTVTVWIERVEPANPSTGDPTTTGEGSTTSTDSEPSGGVTEVITTVPTESTTTTTTTIPTTISTTSIPTFSTRYTAPTATRTEPTVSTPIPTSSVTRSPIPTRITATTVATVPVAGVRPSRVGGSGGDSDDDDRVPVGKWVLFPLIALLILAGGGVAVYFISRPNQPKHH